MLRGKPLLLHLGRNDRGDKLVGRVKWNRILRKTVRHDASETGGAAAFAKLRRPVIVVKPASPVHIDPELSFSVVANARIGLVVQAIHGSGNDAVQLRRIDIADAEPLAVLDEH